MIANILDDDWIEKDDFSGKTRPVEYLDFDDDSLALVCGCLRVGKDLCQTFTTVQELGKRRAEITAISVIRPEDRAQAEKIRRYFKNRIVVRRLKNRHISSWMTKAEAVLETPKTIREDHVSLLVKLPDFYRENAKREAIFKRYKSMPEPFNAYTATTELDSVVRFAGSVERNSKTQKHVTFYFSTEDDYLVAADVEKNDMGYGLWRWLSSTDKPFRIKSELVSIMHYPGYDFYQMKLNSNYDIEEA